MKSNTIKTSTKKGPFSRLSVRRDAIRRAFTLVETIAVIVIGGIIIGLIVKRIRKVSTDKMTAGTVAEQMASICVTARQIGSKTQITDFESAYNAYINGITLTGPAGKEEIVAAGSGDGDKIADMDLVAKYYEWDATNRTIVQKP